MTRLRARRPRASRVVLSIVGIVVALIWLFPVYWMVNSSLLSNVVLTSTTPTFFPVGASFDNFASVIAGGTFLPALGMSVTIALVVVVVCLLFAFLAAVAISRFRFRGRTSFVLAILFVQMLPAEGLFIAQYKLMASVNLLNTVVGVSILYIGAVVPFTIWMLRGFVAGVPAELEEAAMVDGLSRTQAFLRITFPLLAPGLVASGVYAFLQAWNEFTIALVVLPGQGSQTLPLWLRGFIQSSASKAIDWGQVMAASTLVAIPVIVFFLFVQGRMTSGLVGGAVKG
ncbi:carbohydrate ABC transporter permease [Lysinimonas soli]|uniref:Carbohydrate ABC transporter permease n=1 Tax=Lysinimonas soli TaxID=1074233 RepID=A0ABW0NRN6_9MICO